MNLAFIIIGLVSLGLGVVLLTSPALVERMNNRIRRVVMADSFAIKYHRAVGILLLVLAAVLLYYRIQM